MRDGIRELWNNSSLIYLTVAFSSFIGLYFSLGNVLSGLFNPFGYDPSNVAGIGLIMLATGVIGATMTGIILGRTHAYKRLMQVMMVVAGISLGLMCMNLFAGGPEWCIYLYCVPFGLAMISVLPAALGLSVEMTFPMQPAMVNGLLLLFA